MTMGGRKINLHDTFRPLIGFGAVPMCTTLMRIQWLTTWYKSYDMISIEFFSSYLCCERTSVCVCVPIRSVQQHSRMRWTYARHLVWMNHTASMCLCACSLACLLTCAHIVQRSAHSFARVVHTWVQKIRIKRANEIFTRTFVAQCVLCVHEHRTPAKAKRTKNNNENKYEQPNSNVERIPSCIFARCAYLTAAPTNTVTATAAAAAHLATITEIRVASLWFSLYNSSDVWLYFVYIEFDALYARRMFSFRYGTLCSSAVMRTLCARVCVCHRKCSFHIFAALALDAMSMISLSLYSNICLSLSPCEGVRECAYLSWRTHLPHKCQNIN